MADKTIDVTESIDTAQKLIRLKAITGDSDAHAIAVDVLSAVAPTGSATSANQVLELTELRGMNLLSSVVFDAILVTYTGVDKGTISKVEWKLAGVVVKTLTPTFAALTDSWVKS
jgi:hypothetical protein